MEQRAVIVEALPSMITLSVILVLPSAIAVTTPFSSTVATRSLEVLHSS